MPSIALQTRAGTDVDNWQENSPPTPGNVAEAAAFRVSYSAALHRDTPVCFTYNCHGLTFASRRTQINSSNDIRIILNEDGYVRVNPVDVMAGDIVLYVDIGGDVEHSGIVVEYNKALMLSQPRVLSKWGSAHEVIHFLRDCPYGRSNAEFWRVTK